MRSITVIGRREDADLRIPLGDVSRKHCRLIRDGDTVKLEDLGSSNGTYHNGHRVNKDAILQAGDSIQVGPVVFVLQVDGMPADEELHPITTAAAVGHPDADAYAEVGFTSPQGPPGPPPVPPGMHHAEPAGGDEALDHLEALDDLADAQPMDALPAEDALEPIPLEDDYAEPAAKQARAASPPPLPANGGGEAESHDLDAFHIVDESHQSSSGDLRLDHIDLETEHEGQPHQNK